MKPRSVVCLTAFALVLLLAGFTLRAGAGDGQSTPDPTGTWKITRPTTNTQVRPSERTLKLRLTGGKLTGTISSASTQNGKSRIYEWPINEGKLQGNEISFSVTHPFQVGQGSMTETYQGTISGDTMKGTFKGEFLETAFTRPWQAERLKE